ncbi:hypothetical protein [Streptomyces sp. NPDC057253]|uniref:glycosyl hydrolase family 95 catalytic domain-containing protein n=1 Tax=Streptomyces sp. NPDC057253 TaxID=3346069 RepID=UPI00362EFA69
MDDQYKPNHCQHRYGAWPLHEINPEDRPDLVGHAATALDLRLDGTFTAHADRHRALARARLKDGAGAYTNLPKILGKKGCSGPS